MKVFFGANLTEDKNNVTLDGEVFITKKIPPSLEKLMEDKDKGLEMSERLSKLPFRIKILKAFFGFIVIVCIIIIIRALNESSLAQLYEDSPEIFYSIVVSAISLAVLSRIRSFKNVKVLEDEYFTKALPQSTEALNNSYTYLEVPEAAASMDILLTFYKIKNGKIIPKFSSFAEFANIPMKVFLQDDALCFADINNKFSIPLERLIGIRTINERISVPQWNKAIPHNKGEYTQYKITVNNYQQYFFKPYYSLSINHNGEEYELYFPHYELPLVQRLTGKSVNE